MNKDFADFQKYFKHYQKLFSLSGYRVYFKYEKIKSGFADLQIDLTDMVATLRLNSKLPDKDKPFKDIKRSAKHEALHLLVGRLEQNGRHRYIAEEEIYEATEELVFKLEELIKEENKDGYTIMPRLQKTDDG